MKYKLKNIIFFNKSRVTRICGIDSNYSEDKFIVGLNLNPSTYFHPATQGPESGSFPE